MNGSAGTDIRFGPYGYSVFVFLVFCAIVTIIGSKDAADAAGAIGVLVGTGVAGTLFITRSRAVAGRERLGWSLIGSGLISASIGVLVVGIVFFVAGDAPAFGWTDLFFLVTYVFVIAGTATLPHTEGTSLQRARMALDGLIGAVSVAALLWVFLLADGMSDLSTAPMASRIIGALYPFLDLILLTVAMSVLLRRSRHRFDVRMALFTAAVFFQVLGDIVFFASGVSGSFDDAEPLYVINLLAVGFFVAAASLVGQPAVGREYADREPPLWTQIAPYVPAIGMLGVFLLAGAAEGWGQVEPALYGAVIVVGLLVIARQGVAILDNRATIEEQRNVLVSTISHELRTPLTAVVGYLDLLAEERDRLEPDQWGMVTIIQQQADYMSRIVSDLIMLARGTSGDLELDVEPVLVTDLAAASIHASGIPADSIHVECEPDLVAFVDRARMQQVLVNLLSNAARYGGDHRLLRVDSDGSDLVFEVHDDGPGIPRRHEIRVWDRFERGPNRLNASVEGSGIGLAIVRAIAEAHGGTATYRQSSDLGGACFVLTLPGRATHDPTDRTADTEPGSIRSIA